MRYSGAFLAAWLATGLTLGAGSARAPSRAARSSAASDDASLTIASLNMAKETRLMEVSDEIGRLFKQRSADVLFLQEVDRSVNDGDSGIAAELGRTLGLHWQFARADIWGDREEGLAILSRYPLDNVDVIRLKRFDLNGHQRKRIALATSMTTRVGTVRAINVHLDSRINPDERLEQLGPVVESAARFPGPCVVGGDFNTTDFRFVGRWLPIPSGASQQRVVMTTMAASGFETPFVGSGPTFKLLGLKLDWIFARRLRADAWGIDRIEFSDHNAIWTRMSRDPGQQN
jgi:endonuclease/exonuclease/phosphatase family metal-dependent hydrolase